MLALCGAFRILPVAYSLRIIPGGLHGRGSRSVAKIVLLFLVLMVAVSTVFLVGRSRIAATDRVAAPVVQRTQAVRTTPPVNPPSAPSAAGAQNTQTAERIAWIEHELSQIPPDDAEALRQQSEIAKLESARIAELRARLWNSDRALLLQSARSSLGAESNQELELEQSLLILNQELSSAKLALAQQQWLIREFIGSDDSIPVREMRAELGRRQARVAELERRIEELFLFERGRSNWANAQRTAWLRAWRAERAGLETAYADAITAQDRAFRAYQRLAEERTLQRKKAEDLRLEREALLRGN